MIQFLLLFFFLVSCISMLGLYWFYAARRDAVRKRLQGGREDAHSTRSTTRLFARRHPWVPSLLSVMLAVYLIEVVSCPLNLTFGITIVSLFLGFEADAWVYRSRINRIETQLADATDILVSSISSGASFQASLIQSSEFTAEPLRSELESVVSRLRLGDSPAEVFKTLGERVPTETFKLLATTLVVNWNAGGELSGNLSSIAGTIRDRLAIARQIRTLSTQGTLTTVTVLSTIWFMSAMMWQADPIRFEAFLFSTFGSWMISVGLLLQGVGVALVSKISRPKI